MSKKQKGISEVRREDDKITKAEYNIDILRKLKITDIDIENPEVLNGAVDECFYSRTMKRIAGKAIEFSEASFHDTALKLLGYEEGTDFAADELEEFVCSMGFSSPGKSQYTSADFINDTVTLLKSKTADGIQLMEKLCIEGAFDDFNEGKDIPEILVFDGKTFPVSDYESHIFEKVYVEVPVDTDFDGRRDLIEVYIRRPAETEKGMKVPAIYIANPYMMGTNDDLYRTHNVDMDLEVFEETDITRGEIRYVPEDREIPAPREVRGEGKAQAVPYDMKFEALSDWYGYFLVRGYAIVFAGGIGTKGSEGMRTCGSVEETASTVAVIDWLNERVRAFSNRTDNLEVKAYWASGSTGMTGKSYLGTLATAAASTGVEGLRTIVPQAAISNWYEYYRCNGLNVPALGWQGDDADLLAQYCMSRISEPDDFEKVRDRWEESFEKIRSQQDRERGSYNRFWDERNYLNSSGDIKASVFIEHGLRDWNVKPKQFDMLWKELEKHDVPRKMILHQGDHIYINGMSGIDYNDIMNKWYGYWLHDIENDIMEAYPEVIIQSNIDTSIWEGSSSWPFEGTEDKLYYVDREGRLSDFAVDFHRESEFVDDISLTGFDREMPEEFSLWTDSIAGKPGEKKEFRLSFTGEALESSCRISGTARLRLKASLSRETGILSAMLVDYGSIRRPDLEKIVHKKDGIQYGKNAGSDDIVNFALEDEPSDFRIITRGWMCAQNRRSNYNKDRVVPGEMYDFEFDMQPADYTVLKGHRIGLVIYSSDAEATQRPFEITEFKVSDNSIELVIPIKQEGARR